MSLKAVIHVDRMYEVGKDRDGGLNSKLFAGITEFRTLYTETHFSTETQSSVHINSHAILTTKAELYFDSDSEHDYFVSEVVFGHQLD